MRKSPHSSQLVDLRALQAFVVVNEAGSMSLAAQRLGVSQSAVSQLIRNLETDCGQALFDRGVRPSRPTRSGQILLELAENLLMKARAVNDQVRAAGRQRYTQIRFGCVDSFAATLGPSLIRGLSGMAREIQMWSGLTSALTCQLQARELDLAICTDTKLEDARIRRRSLFSENWVAVFPRGHQMEVLSCVADLAKASEDLSLIRYSARSVTGQQVERYIRHLGLVAPRRFEFDATDPILSLVAAGLGWTVSTPICLLQARHHLPDVDVVPLPASRLGNRDFFLLMQNGEWSGLDDQIISMTSTLLRREIMPLIRVLMPALPDGAIYFPEII